VNLENFRCISYINVDIRLPLKSKVRGSKIKAFIKGFENTDFKNCKKQQELV
jgi:hypothetical protein